MLIATGSPRFRRPMTRPVRSRPPLPPSPGTPPPHAESTLGLPRKMGAMNRRIRFESVTELVF